VVTHEIGAPHLADPSRLVAGTKAAVGDQWTHYVDPEPVPEDRIEAVEGGDTLHLGDRTVDVVHTPGHAPHQVVFHERASDALFAGDAAGLRPPGSREIHPTSPPSNFDLEGCLDDAETIADRDPARLCFGHFGAVEFDPSLMDAYGETLTEWVERIRAARTEMDDEAVVDHFVERAEPVDPWGPEKTRAEVRLNVRGVLGYLDREGS
jgi:glyoxylase-like metal-dependent hydrolase (beta-lactamase superfamily II)